MPNGWGCRNAVHLALQAGQLQIACCTCVTCEWPSRIRLTRLTQPPHFIPVKDHMSATFEVVCPGSLQEAWWAGLNGVVLLEADLGRLAKECPQAPSLALSLRVVFHDVYCYSLEGYCCHPHCLHPRYCHCHQRGHFHCRRCLSELLEQLNRACC